MIARDQIVLERLENDLHQVWHMLQQKQNKELVHQMLKSVRAEIAAICSQPDK